MAKTPLSTTVEAYTALDAAYKYFNQHIFKGKLPECMITLAYHRGAYGYFRHEALSTRLAKNQKPWDEIALNPFTFKPRSDREILSTLVHEMVHLWEHHDGKEGKTHHSAKWANKMEEIGLMPSSTGQEGGKRTGKYVSHYIIPGGLFDKVEKKAGIKITYFGNMKEKEKKGSKRVKYTCSECNTNAYGKPDIVLICGTCYEEHEHTEPMEAS